MAIRRINFHGGPGCGKSTMAPDVYSVFKKKHRKIELVQEFIKKRAYEKRKLVSYDADFIFASQMQEEDFFLRYVDAVVTDSPLLMNAGYSTMYGFKGAPRLLQSAKEFEDDFNSLNFYIHRTVPYQADGRFQTEAEAKEVDTYLFKFIVDHIRGPLRVVTVDEMPFILKTIEKEVFGECASCGGDQYLQPCSTCGVTE